MLKLPGISLHVVGVLLGQLPGMLQPGGVVALSREKMLKLTRVMRGPLAARRGVDRLQARGFPGGGQGLLELGDQFGEQRGLGRQRRAVRSRRRAEVDQPPGRQGRLGHVEPLREGPIDRRRPREGFDVKGLERAGVLPEIEMFAGKSQTTFAEGGAACGFREELRAGVRDFRGRSDREEDRLATVLHEEGDVGGRKGDGLSAGEKLGQLGRKAIVVERACASGLHEDVRQGEQLRQPGLGDETEIDDVLLHVGRQ